MAWNKNKIIIGFGFLCSVFVSVFSSSYSYAISDMTITYSANDTISGAIFPSCNDSTCLSQYNYFIYSIPTLWQGNFRFKLNGTTTFYVYFSLFDYMIYKLPPNTSSLEFNTLLSSIPTDMTFTLSESLPTASCPEPEEPEPCPECQVCPTIPDNPYDEKLDNITKAIYVGVATLLVVYFFYCIYRLIIKNSGVK